jgi:hypothetical protein
MKNSTSFHTINADTQKKAPWRLLHRLCNTLNNRWFPNAHDPQLDIRDFACDITEAEWQRLDLRRSPSRILSNLFWLKLPWRAIQAELGRLDIFDTGCGDGTYGVRLQEYTEQNLARYTGVDQRHHARWDTLMAQHAVLHFSQVHSADIAEHIPATTTLFITQSALEHFTEDVTYFQQVHSFIQRAQRSVLQVHLLPSAACLRLYRHHGVRQYTPRTLSMMTRMFHQQSYAVLYKLGGQACNALHWQVITRPQPHLRHLRQTTPAVYEQRVRRAIQHDMGTPQAAPSFYALVIHSNWRQRLFP